MRASMAVLAVLLAILGVGCSNLAVNHDYDPQADFTHLKTFSWHTLPNEAAAGGELVAKRIVDAIEMELAAKGMTKVSANPDFVIVSHLGKQFKRDVMYWDHANRRYSAGPSYDVYEYEEGTLVLSIFDAPTQEMIWRGSVTTIVEPELPPEQRHEKINKAIAKLLEDFPPKK